MSAASLFFAVSPSRNPHFKIVIIPHLRTTSITMPLSDVYRAFLLSSLPSSLFPCHHCSSDSHHLCLMPLVFSITSQPALQLFLFPHFLHPFQRSGYIFHHMGYESPLFGMSQYPASASTSKPLGTVGQLMAPLQSLFLIYKIHTVTSMSRMSVKNLQIHSYDTLSRTWHLGSYCY